MKTTVELPDALFQEAKEFADSRGVPFRQVVEEGLRAMIQQGRQPRKRFRLRDGSFGGQGLQNDLSWSDTRAAIYQGRGE
jgi:hypothetical protein